MFIVQGKSREPAGIVKVTKATRGEALQTANDLQSRGLPFVTIICDGRVYTMDEFASTIGQNDRTDRRVAAAPATSNEQRTSKRVLKGMWQSPSIIPGIYQDVYLVLDDFGRIGWAWRETHVEDTDFESVICDLLEGLFVNPVRVVGFNTAEGWSR